MRIQYDKIHFYGQKQGERIILLTRRHWFIPFKFICFFVFLFILPPVIYSILPPEIKITLHDNEFYILFVLGLSAYYLFAWLCFFIAWLNYYLDVWIVTNERVIDIQQLALFKRKISEQQIIRVQDVTSEVMGIIPTFLDFGNIQVQTAGTEEKFIFKEVPHPNEVKRIILSAAEEANRNQGAAMSPIPGQFVK